MTKGDLAEKIGVKNGCQISRYMLGRSFFEIETLLKLAWAMNMNPQLFFERVAEDYNSTNNVSVSTEVIYHLEMNVKKLYPNTRKIFITFDEGSLLVINGMDNRIEAEFVPSVTSIIPPITQIEDFHEFASDPKYVKILKVIALKKIFDKFSIKHKDLLEEISVIADL